MSYIIQQERGKLQVLFCFLEFFTEKSPRWGFGTGMNSHKHKAESPCAWLSRVVLLKHLRYNAVSTHFYVQEKTKEKIL